MEILFRIYCWSLLNPVWSQSYR